jgi:hypothetical protein
MDCMCSVVGFRCRLVVKHFICIYFYAFLNPFFDLYSFSKILLEKRVVIDISMPIKFKTRKRKREGDEKRPLPLTITSGETFPEYGVKNGKVYIIHIYFASYK